MYKAIFNSLPAHIAVLNEQGIIIKTNRAWQRYGEKNGIDEQFDSIGVNYLALSRVAKKTEEPETAAVAEGLTKVLSGELKEFVGHYPCHSPAQRQWFNVRIISYYNQGKKRVLVVHEDVTPLIAAQEELRQKDKELQRKSLKLEETNIALTILADHRNKELKELEQKISRNIKDLVLPYVEKLKSGKNGARQEALIEIIETNLKDIVQPFLHKIAALHLQLSPQEVEIASLIHQGKSSQEIADILRLSINTISFHRRNLRRKLGLRDRSENLQTFLLSLQ